MVTDEDIPWLGQAGVFPPGLAFYSPDKRKVSQSKASWDLGMINLGHQGSGVTLDLVTRKRFSGLCGWWHQGYPKQPHLGTCHCCS